MKRDRWVGELIADRYRILERLADGGMGRIYVAEHVELEMPVALKLLPAANQPEDRVERFRREARAMARVRSPHIAPAFDFGQLSDGSFFFAMELLVGEDLSCTMEREGPIAPERTIVLLRQVAHALDAAHALGFVHRDLKPDNVFLVEDLVYGELVKVLDFGIAKQILKATSQLTAAGSVLGTPAYMAPEQVRSDTPVSPATDVYALGAMAFEMLTGELPYDEESVFAMLEALQTRAPRVPSEVGLHVEGLDDVMRTALARHPSDRYANATALVDALERVLLDPSAARGAEPAAEPEDDPVVTWDDAEPTMPVETHPRPSSEAHSLTSWLLASAAATVSLLVGFALGALVG